MRLLIVTPNELGVSETFIRAHIERLPHDVVAIAGYQLNYRRDGIPLRNTHAHKAGYREARWLNLLPRFLEFRFRRYYFPNPDDFAVARAFIREERIDLVLAEYGTAAAFITPLCRALGIPLVAHFHGSDASRRNTLETFAASYREMFAYASAVISVSNAMTDNLIRAGCPPDKIIKNPYGPDPAFFEVEPDYESDTIIAVGRHTAKKAPYLTLDAFRRARAVQPGLRLCMIGDGELFEVAENLVKAWDLTEFVDLVGAADSVTIMDYMRNAFLFVQHSIQARNGDSEGMPVAILEAGAASLPVVSTRHAGIPESVIDGSTGFIVEPGDAKAMAEKIIAIAENRKLAQDMGEKAKTHISNNYSMSQHIRKLSNILENALLQ